MARIALDARFYRAGTGGIGRYSRNLLGELLKIDRENHYTAIITPEDEAEFDLRSPNLDKLVAPIRQYTMAEQTKFLSILNAQKFDLVHFTNFNHPILYRRPFVVTVHDLIMGLYPTGAQKKSRVRRAAYRWVMNDCKRARRIIVPSQATRNDLVTMYKFPYDNMAVTPEASEPLFREHTEREKLTIKERLELPKKYLLYVSRWEAYKGLPVLLEAYRQLTRQWPDLGLVICGKPSAQNPEVALLVEAAQSNNSKIVTPGFVSDEDLAAVYAAAEIYVHPCSYEGFGIMILEAFASGVPVVTSNTSSLPEVVGNAGLLVDPKNPDELTNAVEKILTDKKMADDLRAKGFERVKQYSWAKMAAQTLEIYKEVLG